MGLFDKLWVDPNKNTSATPEKKEEKVVQPATTSRSIPTSTPIMPSTITSSISTNAVGSVNKEFVEYFQKVFNETNLPGPDFHEFVNALDNMKSIPMDEHPKYMAVYATLITQGCTKEKLVSSAGIYLQKFAEKHTGFTTAISDQLKTAVGDKQNTIDELKKKNDAIDAEIQRLATEKVSNAEQSNRLTMEMNEESMRLSIKKADFDATYNDMVSNINNVLGKIQTYINN